MATRRPLLMSLLPDRLKSSAFHRLYNPLPDRLVPLLNDAPLRFAPTVRMAGLVRGDVISNHIAVTRLLRAGTLATHC